MSGPSTLAMSVKTIKDDEEISWLVDDEGRYWLSTDGLIFNRQAEGVYPPGVIRTEHGDMMRHGEADVGAGDYEANFRDFTNRMRAYVAKSTRT